MVVVCVKLTDNLMMEVVFVKPAHISVMLVVDKLIIVLYVLMTIEIKIIILIVLAIKDGLN